MMKKTSNSKLEERLNKERELSYQLSSIDTWYDTTLNRNRYNNTIKRIEKEIRVLRNAQYNIESNLYY